MNHLYINSAAHVCINEASVSGDSAVAAEVKAQEYEMQYMEVMINDGETVAPWTQKSTLTSLQTPIITMITFTMHLYTIIHCFI